MNPAITLATTRRVLQQLRQDPRTIAMMILLPALLVVVLSYVLNSPVAFQRVAPSLLGIFPFVVMFLIASVGTLRERTSGTLERLMTMPIAKLDLLLGYALAFGVFAVAQVIVVAVLAIAVMGLSIAGPATLLAVIAVLDALLGMALGLFVSAFARTEFQAVQFMPLFAFPQVLLCGLFAPRDQMAPALSALSDLMPLSYAVDAIKLVAVSGVTDFVLRDQLIGDLAIVTCSALLALVLGAATLSRRTT
jgi:ABC-2 type transport system permease protein